jgi:hypothetical protein
LGPTESSESIDAAVAGPIKRALGSVRHSLKRSPRQVVRSAISWLRRQEGSPGHQARGLAIGVFIGCLPIFGIQILTSVIAASALRGNKLLAVGGTMISNPLTTLPLFWLNYQLGTLLMGPGPAWSSLKNFTPRGLAQLGWSFSSRLMLGSVLVGAMIAAATGVGCWIWLQNRRRRQAATLR